MRQESATFVTLAEDVSLVSLANGGLRTYMVTPKEYWTMGLNLDMLVACLRVRNASANVGITTRAEWSFDGQNWQNYVASSVIGQVNTNSDYRGGLDASDFLPPYIRLVLDVVATSGSNQEGADISLWGYYKFRV